MTLSSARGAASFARWSFLVVWMASLFHAWRGGYQRGLESPTSRMAPFVYPWAGVFVTALVITAVTAIVYAAIRPSSFAWSPKRAAVALFVALALATLFVLNVVTDLPGYAYAPVLATILLLALTLVLLLLALGMSRKGTTT